MSIWNFNIGNLKQSTFEIFFLKLIITFYHSQFRPLPRSRRNHWTHQVAKPRPSLSLPPSPLCSPSKRTPLRRRLNCASHASTVTPGHRKTSSVADGDSASPLRLPTRTITPIRPRLHPIPTVWPPWCAKSSNNNSGSQIQLHRPHQRSWKRACPLDDRFRCQQSGRTCSRRIGMSRTPRGSILETIRLWWIRRSRKIWIKRTARNFGGEPEWYVICVDLPFFLFYFQWGKNGIFRFWWIPIMNKTYDVM